MVCDRGFPGLPWGYEKKLVNRDLTQLRLEGERLGGYDEMILEPWASLARKVNDEQASRNG